MLEVLDHGIYKFLVRDDDGILFIMESRHVTFDESKFLGAPDLKNVTDEEASEDRTWVANVSKNDVSINEVGMNCYDVISVTDSENEHEYI